MAWTKEGIQQTQGDCTRKLLFCGCAVPLDTGKKLEKSKQKEQKCKNYALIC